MQTIFETKQVNMKYDPSFGQGQKIGREKLHMVKQRAALFHSSPYHHRRTDRAVLYF